MGFMYRAALCIAGAVMAASAPLDYTRASHSTESPQADRLSASSGRPLADVVTQIETRFGWIVTYEDPPYVHDSEIADVSAAVRRDRSKPGRTLVPLGGTLVFDLPVNPTGSPAEPGATLGALLKDYARSGLPGGFALRQTPGMWHIVPTRMKGADAAIQPYQSILDSRISIPAANRDGLEMMSAFVEAVKREDPRLVVGTIPLNAFASARFDFGAANEPARDALVRVMRAVSDRLSWRLLCAPGVGAICALNIHVVRTP